MNHVSNLLRVASEHSLCFVLEVLASGWLRWMEGVNAEIKVVDEVKMKRCNGLHTIDTQVIDQNNIVID